VVNIIPQSKAFQTLFLVS